jgi:hypothetical protein
MVTSLAASASYRKQYPCQMQKRLRIKEFNVGDLFEEKPRGKHLLIFKAAKGSHKGARTQKKDNRL